MIRFGELRPAFRLALFAAGLAVVAAAAALAGQASGIDSGAGAAASEPAHGGDGSMAGAYGLSDTASGLTLSIEPTSLTAGAKSRLAIDDRRRRR